MTLEQYLKIMLKHWRLILSCFLLVGLGAYIGSRLMKPLYQSSALVQVVISSGTSGQADYTNLSASNLLVQTEATLAVSTPVLREVASHYPRLTDHQLLGEVTSTPKLNTQLFEVDVVDPSRTRAADLANDIAATLIRQQSQGIEKWNAKVQLELQQGIDQIRKNIDDLTTKISALNAQGGNQGQVALLQSQLSELQLQESQYQIALIQLKQGQGVTFLQVVQLGEPALSPLRPNIPLYTGAGLLLGLLLGMLLAVFFESLDTRVRTPEALNQLLNVPVLATIWLARSSKKEDVFNPAGHDVNVESYRILRTNLGFLSINKPLRSLMVTSALSRDGRSTIAANLAIFMAKAGKPTLLIDADLRHPTLSDLFSLSADKMGLSNAVLAMNAPLATSSPLHLRSTTLAVPQSSAPTANLSLEPFIHSTGIPNLWVMPSGPLPPNPSELLDSKAMQLLLTEIANCGVEVVIFDTPPLLGLSDASMLASKVDGVLIVADVTHTNKRSLEQMKSLLLQAGIWVVGCVVNKQRHSRNDMTYSYYSYQTDEQNGRRDHNMGKKGSPALSTVPVNVFRRPEMENGEGNRDTPD